MFIPYNIHGKTKKNTRYNTKSTQYTQNSHRIVKSVTIASY